MKESSFVNQNKAKWEDLEKELRSRKKDPDKISRLFVQITDDLSFAQTFYQSRSVRVYLNGVAQMLFNSIYRNNRFRWSAFINFWKTDLPVIIYNARQEFLISLLVFIVAMTIGILSSVNESNFARQILGDAYVEMTLENIRNNDPMAIYKEGRKMDMFLGITLNNIYIAFYTFVFGIFLGIGTVISLIRNGIMVGTFQYFFIEHDLFKESFLTIWQHGTLEISSIIIAGAAGLTMSRGILFPGTYKRLQALKLSAKRGLRIMLGIVPIFIFAAFIEGFFTRYTDSSDTLRIFVILFSLFFIIGYFGIYPLIVARRHPEKIRIADKIEYTDKSIPDLMVIQTDEQLFASTLKTLKIFRRVIILAGLVLASFPAILTAFFADKLVQIKDGILFSARGYTSFFNYRENVSFFFINTVLLALCLLIAAVVVRNLSSGKKQFSFSGQLSPGIIINGFLASLIINLPYFIEGGWSVTIQILILPVFVLALYGSIMNRNFLVRGIGHAFILLGKCTGKLILLYLKFLFLSFVALLLIGLRFYWDFLEALSWNFRMNEQIAIHIFDFAVTLIYYFIVYFSFVTISIAIFIFYHTADEITNAGYLKERIKKIGTKKIIKGYEFDQE
ncbi:MAG: stage II sporulation protein M [Bacteroidales bacterium]|jgi:uncharacterized membrane protein SpoIIM required for sporulation